jgi:hypothetical protein
LPTERLERENSSRQSKEEEEKGIEKARVFAMAIAHLQLPVLESILPTLSS